MTPSQLSLNLAFEDCQCRHALRGSQDSPLRDVPPKFITRNVNEGQFSFQGSALERTVFEAPPRQRS